MTFSVPNRPPGSATRDIAQIIADFDAMAADYETTFSAWKDICQHNAFLSNGKAAGTYIVDESVANGTSPFNWAAASSSSVIPIWLDPADFAVASPRTAKLRVRLTIHTTALAPAANYTAGLYPITTNTGSWTAGTVVATSQAAINGPAINTITSALSSAFACPAAGPYLFQIILSAIPASSVVANIKLQMQQT
jgi:hypothetical protein